MQQNAGSNLLEKKLNLKKYVWASFNLIVISHASWSWIVFLCFIPWFSKGKVRLFLSKNAIYAKLLYEKIRKNIYWVAIIDDSRKMFVKNQHYSIISPKNENCQEFYCLQSRSTQTQNFRILNRNWTKKEWGLCL